MISVLMPYYDRLPQLFTTLESFQRLYGHRSEDLEIVIVVDRKSADDTPDINKMLNVAGFPFKLLHAGMDSYSPAPHYNQAARAAGGDRYVITSPEVLHVSDILVEVEGRDHHDYAVFACEGLHADGSFHRWLQHSSYRPANYHFCTAISAHGWDLAGGFDIGYAQGIAYDDDDFLRRVERAGLQIKTRDDVLTRHQWHSKYQGDTVTRAALVERNKKLFDEKWGRRQL